MWRQTFKNITVFLVLILIYQHADGACRQSYMTFCDDFSDLDKIGIKNITQLVIGSEFSNRSQMSPINFDTIAAPFNKFYKLKGLIILGRISDIKSYTFSIDPDDLTLDYLQLYGNNIRRLRYSAFDSMKIRRFSFTNNNLEDLQKDTFYNCDFQTIDLSYNNLEMIEVNIFSDESLAPNATEEIVIKYNQLEAIAPKSFPNSLKILNLDYNKLKVLNHGVFENLCNLEELTMSHNKVSSIPEVSQATNLRILDFSHNDIPWIRLHNLNNLTNLEILDLSYNKILNTNLFQLYNNPGQTISLQISLVFNKLAHLDISHDSFKNHTVLLYGNPWNCKCWEMLEKFIVQNKVKRNECDVKFFGNGRNPYCINYPGNDCKDLGYKKNPEFSEEDLKKFLDLIENATRNIDCSLSPQKKN